MLWIPHYNTEKHIFQQPNFFKPLCSDLKENTFSLTITFFKKFTAEGFYKFMKVMGADVVYNHADFRLMSARVLQELANYKEVNLFLRGMVQCNC